MPRQRFHSLAALTLTLSGFAACTFGADDFEIVPADGSGGSSSGGSPNAMGGGDDQGGSDSGPTAGGDSVAGAGLGGETSAAGAGGAATGPRYTCAPLSPALTVFTPLDLGDRPIQEEPTLVAMGEGVVVLVATEASGATQESTLHYRAISDSGGGMVEQPDSYIVNGGRLQIKAAAVDGTEIKLLGAAEGAFDLTIPTTDNGRGFGPPLLTELDVPESCLNLSPENNGSLRNLEGSYDGGWTYAVTCATRPAGLQEHYALHLSLGPQEIAPLQELALDNIVRQYAKIGDSHFIMVGNDAGRTVGVRFGTTQAELATVHSMALSDDSTIYSAFLLRPLPLGLFLHGVAFTAEPDPPPLVPAEIYDGSVDIADAFDLFVDAGDGNRPPSPLRHTASFTKASELVDTQDALVTGANVLLGGATFSPRNSLQVALVRQDGTVLAPPTEIYQTQATHTIEEGSVRLARLGIGFVAVWVEDGTVKARTVSCLQD